MTGSRSGSPAPGSSAGVSPVGKPDFLQPAYDFGGSLGRQRPPRLPAEIERALAEKTSTRGSVDGLAQTPLSSRASSPRRRTAASPTGTPRGASRSSAGHPAGASSTGAPSSAGSGQAQDLSASSQFGGTGSFPGNPGDPSPNAAGIGELLAAAGEEGGKKQEMLMMGYLPTGDYGGIMSLNKELREQNKRLRAELVSVQVEHERLRMEEQFLRESAVKAGHVPPMPVSPARSKATGHDGFVSTPSGSSKLP